MKNINWQSYDIRYPAMVASLLVSALILLVQDAPNDDAYAYIRTAEIALSDGIGAAIEHYAWVSYSLLIALIGQLGIDLLTAAYLINSLFFALLVFSYLSIVRLLNDSTKVSVLAALCILLYPQLNEFRFDVIRDVGYWSLSLFALWQFLLFFSEYKNKHLFGFGIGLLLAASFRPEALVYLLATPFVLLLDRSVEVAQRRKYFSLALGVAAGIIVLSFLVLAILGVSVSSILSDFLSVYEPFLTSTFNPDEAESSEISSAIFGSYAASYSGPYITLFLVSGLLAILIVKLFAGIGGPFFWLLVYGGYLRAFSTNRKFLLPIVFFLVTNVAIVFMFILVTRFVSSRYAMLFCLLLVLFVPLVLAKIVDLINQSTAKDFGMRALILFFGYCAFDSFISFGQSKTFVFDSVDWIVSQADENAGLLTNNHAVAYYSGRVPDYDQIERFLTAVEIQNTEVNDLIAIEMHFEMSELVASATVNSLIEFQTAFPSLDDQQLAIYKRVNP